MKTRFLLFFITFFLISFKAFQVTAKPEAPQSRPAGFVSVLNNQFMLDGKPFRFVGANVAVVFRKEDRDRMPDTMREAAADGLKVVRVWAYGEGDETSPIQPIGSDKEYWHKDLPFRRSPNEWNEEAFVHLDRIIAEAEKNKLLVQLCFVNWWRDTGGVTQYLDWAGIHDAADEKMPYGIHFDRALLFYTNPETRRLYKEHVKKILTRKNTITGKFYKEDPTIFGYELMNEAQSAPGHWLERREWIREMSGYIKSIDPHHLVTPGTWGYRTSWERREWLEDHQIDTIDYADIHLYPSTDLDSFVEKPEDLKNFIENRVAAAYTIQKPVVLGEFNVPTEGYKGFSREAWFDALLKYALESGLNGTIYWILTPDPKRYFGVSYTDDVDHGLRTIFKLYTPRFANETIEVPEALKVKNAYLQPNVFKFERNTPLKTFQKDEKTSKMTLGFSPETALKGEFEKWGVGIGYIWGVGTGFFEYGASLKGIEGFKPSKLTIRAHLQPIPPWNAKIPIPGTSVSLSINGRVFGARFVPIEEPGKPKVQQWEIVGDDLKDLFSDQNRDWRIRFFIAADAHYPFGMNLSNYDGHNAIELFLE